MKMAHRQAQQGDVTFQKIDSLPRGCLPIQAGKYILARGETNGYTHSVLSDEARLFEKNGTLYLSVYPAGAMVCHGLDDGQPVDDGHGAIMLGNGVWEVGRIREYDYLAREPRAVRD